MPILQIDVYPPVKSTTRYEFSYVCKGGWKREVYHFLRQGRSLRQETHVFGFNADNFEIPHHEMWDSVYPLIFFTREASPIFRQKKRVRIIFHYPILEPVKRFYVKRARQFGMNIEVIAKSYNRTFPWKSVSREALLFSGGKDSRLLYGALREIGALPEVFMAYDNEDKKFTIPADMPGYRYKSLSNNMINRIMPALMFSHQTVYLGSGFGEATKFHPWSSSFDLSPIPLQGLSSLLHSLGIRKELRAPLAVLPSNLIQYILSNRYPDLAKHQTSTPVNEYSEKNLQISLIKLHRGIDFFHHCSESLFHDLLDDFFRTTAFQAYERKTINRISFHDEMKAILFRKKNHPLLASINHHIPSQWDADWIDYIHLYMDPISHPDSQLTRLFATYAPVRHKYHPSFPRYCHHHVRIT